MNVLIVQGLLLAFFLVVILMPGYLQVVKHLGLGQRIREGGPHTHTVKEGTPTRGGPPLSGGGVARARRRAQRPRSPVRGAAAGAP